MRRGNGGVETDAVYDDNIQAMLAESKITGFEWDAGNAQKSVHKHGVTQAEAEQVFFNEPLLIAPDTRHSAQEIRYHALGRTDDDRLLHITFTVRGAGTLIRVISAREMASKERKAYEQALEGHP